MNGGIKRCFSSTPEKSRQRCHSSMQLTGITTFPLTSTFWLTLVHSLFSAGKNFFTLFKIHSPKLQCATSYRVFSLTCPAFMQIYWNKRKRLHKKRVQLPEDWFGTPTWPPFHCFGTPIWPPWRHVKTLYCCVGNYVFLVWLNTKIYTGTMGSNSQNLRTAYLGEFLSLCLANQGEVIHATPLEAVCFAHCTYHLVLSPWS